MLFVDIWHTNAKENLKGTRKNLLVVCIVLVIHEVIKIFLYSNHSCIRTLNRFSFLLRSGFFFCWTELEDVHCLLEMVEFYPE